MTKNKNALNETRFLRMSAPVPDSTWMLVNFEGTEQINKPYSFQLACFSNKINLNYNDLCAKNVTLTIGKNQYTRTLSGIIIDCTVGEVMARNYQAYTLTIQPWIAFLGDTINCRVFQYKTPIEIFKSICKSYQFSDYDVSALTTSYQSIEYCTQYNESDLAFINRLFQQAGISYFFTHDTGKQTMVLFDNVKTQPTSNSAVIYHSKLKASTVIHAWQSQSNWYQNQNSDSDFDFSQASKAVTKTSAHQEKSVILDQNKFEYSSYANPLFQPVKETEYLNYIVTAQTNHLDLKPGTLFQLSEHPDQTQQGEYFIQSITHHAQDYSGLPFAHESPKAKDHTQYYENDVQCFLSSKTYAPIKSTPWPKITGNQTATIVGTTEHAPYVNKDAQVKLQFHWDREGQYTETSSSWVRIGHIAAGKNHGHQFMPRVGSEVIVDFIGGNPDRPQISGMMPNQRNILPFPTDKNPNISGFKTRSIASTDQSFANELSFDDTAHQEKLNLHAHNAFNLNTKGNETLSVTQEFKHHVSGDTTLSSLESVTYQADQSITLDGGGSTITMTPTRIKISTSMFSTGMPGIASTLPKSVPIYVPKVPSVNSVNTAKNRATALGPHWIQGAYLDSTGKGLKGMAYTIKHSDGTIAKGTLDALGQTKKVSQLQIGTATLIFGDRPKLETQLTKERTQLQTALDSILAKTKAYAAAHPDTTINENWVGKDYDRSVAFIKGVGVGAIKTVKSEGVGIVHLFEDMAESESLESRGMADTLSGNTQDLAKVDQASIAQGDAMFAPLAKGVKLMHLIFEDAQTRKMLETFAQDYYQSETPMMVDKQIGAMFGGIVLGLIVAVITDNPTAIVSGLANKVGTQLANISKAANNIADILAKLKETKTLEGVALDQKHVSIIRPEGIDEGAQHISQATKYKPNKSQELSHPSGMQYNLPAAENKNFSGKPEAFEAKAGESYIRIMDKTNPYSKANGAWWMKLNEVPKTKAQWRSLFAVLEKWNKDGSYVLWKADKPLPGWKGLAATQKLKDETDKTIPNWILEGGGEQLYFPTSQIDIPENLGRHSTQDWEWINE